MSTRPIKVLMTTSVFPRWQDDSTPPFILNLCRDLQGVDCDITVLAPHSQGSLKEETLAGVRVVRFSYMWPNQMQSLCYEGGMNVRLRENPFRSLQLPFFSIAQWWVLRRLLKEPFDLIHAHSLLPQGWITSVANAGKIPILTSSHGADVNQLKGRWAPILKKTVAASNALVANSASTEQRLRELGAPVSKIHRIPATPNYPDPVQITHDPTPGPVILYAGRWIPEKGVDALIEAMSLIRLKLPGARLRLAGAGSLEGNLRRQVNELGLDEAVKFLGWQDSEQLREEMKRASLLVAPSRVIEGQNLVVTEALSVGCPVATTPRGGVLDLVSDQVTGFIIPDSTAEAIADTVVNGLADAELMERISWNGYAHFQENFSRQQIITRTMALYHSIVELKANQPS